ncbi:MAG TPA: MarC family protein [Burkholderiales bacterium]|nr:MarC family protein [Burkholderiales bacterium]
MGEWGELIKLTVALVAVVDPFGTIPLFLSALGPADARLRARAARAAALTVLTVLALAALAGETILRWFGISIASFMVGGAILLLIHGISMLQVRESRLRQTPEEAAQAAQTHAVGVVPIGIPLLAGPGAISAVIIYAHEAPLGPWLLLAPVAVVALVVWGTLRASATIAQAMGTTGLNIMTRVMGLILSALAVEIMARGLVILFPGLK